MGEEDTMKTRRITRPTLADLWRHLLATLEGLGAEDAPTLARSLAVSGLVGRHAMALGIRVERSGEVFTITSPEPLMIRTSSGNRHGVRGRTARRRTRVPAGC
jgi:hypothetical protein